MAIQSLNPTTGKVEKTFDAISKEMLETKLAKAEETFHMWKNTSFSERARLLHAAAEEMKTNARAYGEIITTEMGKPIAQATSEVEKCAWNCEHYADNGEAYLRREPIQTEASESYVQYDPLGVILLVMPWNFPFCRCFVWLRQSSWQAILLC